MQEVEKKDRTIETQKNHMHKKMAKQNNKEKGCTTCDSFLGSGAGGAQAASAGASSGKACRKLEGTNPLCPFRSP